MLVKICGITNVADGLLAADLGASAIGFVFWKGSPRFVTPREAGAIGEAVGPLMTTVGVFVDADAEEIARVVAGAGIDVVQLHGNEAPELIERLERRVIRSVALDSEAAVAACDSVPARATLLLDAHDPVHRGGTGRLANWTAAATVARWRRVILSGGLRPDNVGAAIDVVRPYGVDVSSGVEVEPGRKDPVKLEAFLAAVDRMTAEVRSSEVSDD